MTTNANSHLRRLAKGTLLASAAFPLSALVIPAIAHAEQAVDVNSTETAASVQTKIDAAKATPDRDIKVTVTSKGIITGPGTVGVVAAAGQADGTITFNNGGSIGALDKAGAVADSVAVNLVGSTAKSDSTLAATNSGLITGGFSASGFGGTASLDNSGSIYNGVSVTGLGNVSVKSSGAVRSGDVTGLALATTKSVTKGDTTTNDFTSGNVTAAVADVVSADGKTRGDAVFSAAYGNVDATLSGVAGNVVASSNGASATAVFTNVAVPPAGKTTVINETSTVFKAGSVKITATDKSDLDSIVGTTNGNVEISAAGVVTNNVVAASAGNSNSSFKNTVTLDGKGGLLEQATASSNSAIAGDSTVKIASTGDIGGSVTVAATRDASIAHSGTVGGSLSSTGGAGSTSSNSNVSTYDGAGAILKQVSTNASGVSGGKSTIDVAEGASVGGNVGAFANGNATVNNAGTIDGGINVNAGNTGSSSNAQTVLYDGKGTIISNDFKSSNTSTAGNATVAVAATGSVDGSIAATASQDIAITNAGKIGAGVFASSSANNSTSSFTSLTPVAVVDAKAGTTTTQSSFVQDTTKTATTGKLAFTNASTGVVGFNGVGSVILSAGGDVTVVNQGEVRGTTNAQSSAQKTTSGSKSQSTNVVIGKGGSTSSSQGESSSSTTSIGGSVTGTYAGANGTLNFSPAAVGNVTQTANQASTATVTGAIFGDLSSKAGSATYASTTNHSTNKSATVLDGAGSGTFTNDTTASTERAAITGGDSKVDVSGRVAYSNAGGGASVSSSGTNSSSVAISGSVGGNVNSNASGATASKSDTSTSLAQTITTGVYVTDTLTTKVAAASVVTDGAASASITGTATPSQRTVGGSVTVTGVSSAAADVGSKAVIGGNLNVSTTNGFDSTSSTDQSFVRDAKTGAATATQTLASTSGPSAVSGNSAATIAGTVEGGVNVTANRGNATVTLTGVAENYATANANGAVSKSSTNSVWTGKTNSGSGDFNTLVNSLLVRTLEEVTVNENTAIGGKATVLVDSAQALTDNGVVATDYVSASGLAGADVTVTAGSIVDGDVDAISVGYSSVSKSTTSNDGKGVVNQSYDLKYTITGGAATVTNAGQISSDVSVASATSATVNNTGLIDDDVNASAIFGATNQTSVTTNVGMASLQTTTETNTPVNVLGKASVTNAAGAIIGEDIFVDGGEGTVTNNGTVGGTTNFGSNLDTGTTTVVRTDTTTTETYTPAAALVAQTYTANQNGVSGGFYVGGGLDNNQSGDGRVKTSDVKATINLNSGSTTLGGIFGEVDEDGNRTTNTTVNLVGSGFLGTDRVVYPGNKLNPNDDNPTPVASLGKDAQNLFGGQLYPVRVVGVETLNKEGAGTFVITGEEFFPGAPGVDPVFTLDVGNFNVKAGEVQLTTLDDDAVFGVRGNINNSATLVIGRRITAGQSLFGNNLVGGSEYIDGITVEQVGDYNQTATGSTVVGITPTLLRTFNPSVDDGSFQSELLGPVTGGVSVGYFTTPQALGLEADNSQVNITGNLNLAGKVAVNVYRDSLYGNGDGYTLFTYTGTGAVTATATPSLTSPYVGFALVHDTATKEVRLEVKRTSYAAGATNPNAQSAATGLDSALASAITRIRTDAAGGAGFSSVTDLAYAQDIANVATALDFRLSPDQASQLFNELSSGEVYGSLAAVDQNGVFGQTVDMLANRRSFGGDFATQLWLNPVGRWGKYGDGDAYGASDIRSNSYGLAGGLDFAYAADGAFGFGAAYAEHDIAARGTPEAVDGSTWTVGAYATQGFGPIYTNAKLAFGWTNYDVTRTMSLLARTAEASVNSKQLDASLELGYDYRTGNMTVTPFGKLVLRRTSTEGFIEEGAGAFSLAVDGRKKTVFSPVLGVKIGAETQVSDSVTLRPYAKASYTFQGQLPNDVTVRYVGGGDKFVLRGVEPDSYGMIEAGFEATVADRLSFFLSGNQTFGGDNKVSGLSGGVKFQF